MEKADLSKGYQNPKRKLGVSTHFSEIIEHKFGKIILQFLAIFSLTLAPLCQVTFHHITPGEMENLSVD